MSNIDNLTINTIRFLSAEAIQAANSGHPGLPLGAAPMAYTLWAKCMKANGKNPDWVNRDRFILSAGHGSMLLYSLLHLFGYGLTIEDLKKFRKLDSLTPGHPEFGHTKGVEITTGPLGQGIANAVGFAMAESHLAARFNKEGYNVVDHYTYSLVGDGCLMEGVSAEAASLAGTLKLGKLITLYDSNNISIEGSTDIAFTENVGKRFEAYDWQVINVQDGTDVDTIEKAINEAKADITRPSLIIIKTKIGHGSPKEASSSAHGEPLGAENIIKTKENLAWSYNEEFHVPDEVRAHMDSLIEKGIKAEEEWNEMFAKYREAYPELSAEWDTCHSEDLADDLLYDEDFWTFTKGGATRNFSGDLINKLAQKLPNLFGGSADLAPSNKTNMKGAGDFSAQDRTGKNLHFGVREHAMAAIGNAIAAYGGLITYVSTFFVFSDYMKGSMRLSALMKLPLIYVLTHDSIGVGEDGPTHEPIEQLAALRSIPNFNVIRPADGVETAAAWYAALTSRETPTALVLTRQNLPYYKETSKQALMGAYILVDSEKQTPDVILMASGSEVEFIYNAHAILKEKGIDARVVSMPSFELFDAQEDEYKESVLPKKVTKRVAMEAATSFGWHKYVGFDGKVISIDTFGASGEGSLLFKKFGMTTENVVNTVVELMK